MPDRKSVAEQVQWIAEHGGSLAGYVERYGSANDAEHHGDGGEAIYFADLNELARLITTSRTYEQLSARLDEATDVYREARDRVALLTAKVLAARAREVYPNATHIGLVPTDQDTSGAQCVASVISNDEVVAYDGDDFDDVPVDNLDDANAHVWELFALDTAFTRNDLGTKFLSIVLVLSTEI